ncbi:hypothetical protein MATL_G00030990 [Megalops atlanticus]|uniref:Cystatin fetuin-A-type domain-containing protein n=1 Tax=Megalops atlanticus TaxID=7932 RepID=A0A9D3TG77_MEGAT|nr:hypothetical protein MATL_G00030990 [Megalops atlanticus]
MDIALYSMAPFALQAERAMRELVALIVLVGALCTSSLPLLEHHSIACNDQGVQAAVAVFQHRFNAHRRYGYKYTVSEIESSKLVQKENSTCEFQLELGLEETKCHVVNPKPVDQCEVRQMDETKVKADCNVTLTVADGRARLKRYFCVSSTASAEELANVCPDCPSLLPLHDPQGLDSIKKALKKFNEQSNHTAYFKLLAVGRISTQYTFLGQSYFAEFAIVETSCSRQVEAEKQDACEPLCADEAHHGFCTSTLLGNDEVTVECEIYDVQVLHSSYQCKLIVNWVHFSKQVITSDNVIYAHEFIKF